MIPLNLQQLSLNLEIEVNLFIHYDVAVCQYNTQESFEYIRSFLKMSIFIDLRLGENKKKSLPFLRIFVLISFESKIDS